MTQLTYDEALIADLRANLVEVANVRDELYCALDARTTEAAELRQQIATLEAQLSQRDKAQDDAAILAQQVYTFSQMIAERDERIGELEQVLGLRNTELSMLAYYADNLVNTANESTGIAGWHLNGDVEPWESVEDVQVLANFVQVAVKRYGKACIEVHPDHFGLCGDALPFEETPAKDSEHAPEDASMRDGLEYVKADPIKYISTNFDDTVSVRHMAVELMRAFDCNESTAKRYIEKWMRSNQ